MTGLKIDRAALRDELAKRVKPRAEIGGEFLCDALSHEGHGILWANYGNKNRSSLPDEYPALQEGNLRDAVDVRQGKTPLEFKIGFFADKNAEGLQEAVELEARPANQGGRYPLELLLEDRDMWDAVLSGEMPW